MKSRFDQIISRQGTNALAHDGYEGYLFGSKDNFPKLNYKKEELISMWVADMQFAAPDCAIAAMSKRLEHPIYGYTMNFDNELYEAFKNWCLKKYNWKFSKDEMQVSLGVIPALIGLVEYICAPDEKVLAFTPTYAYFKHATDRTGRQFVTSKLIESGADYQIDFSDFENKVKDPKVKMLMLCHPHNPTGRVWTEEELQKIGEICFRNGVKIVSDEIHCDLVRNGIKHTPLAQLFPESKDVVTCMAVSKTFNLAGLMVATIIIPDPALRKIWIRKHYTMMNPLSHAAAVAAYREGGEWLDELKTYLDYNFKFTSEFLKMNLPKAIFKIPDATYLAWIDFKAYFSEGTNLTKFFLENAGVILEGAEMFVENGGLRVRLNLACPLSQLKLALERMHQAIQRSNSPSS